MSTPYEFALINRQFHELNPLLFGFERCSPGHSFGPAARFYYLIHCIHAGSGIFVRDGKEYQVHAGQCFVIRPNETTFYRASEETPWSYTWIGFSSTLPLPDKLSAPIITSTTVCKLFAGTLDTMLSSPEQPEICLTAFLWQLYAHFATKDPTIEAKADHTEALMLRAKNIIETEYMNEITVAGIASRLHLERSYFSTLFRKHFGTSPQQYLVDYRLSVAAALIEQHSYSIAQAARTCGYPDPCNFSRMFRRKFGCSPSEHEKKKIDSPSA